MAQEFIQDLMAVFQVIDGFKQRHYRNSGGETLIGRFHQPGFTLEQINNQEVTDISGHADDDRSYSFRAVTAYMFPDNPEGIDGRAGLSAK
jgi:hypothetical protein